MNILLIYTVRFESENRILNAINSLLLKHNHTVVSISKKKLSKFDYKLFSLILTYNTFLTKNVLKCIEKESIPKILIIEESKIFQRYIYQPYEYDKIILIKDQHVKTVNYLPKALITYIPYPYCEKNGTVIPKKNRSLKIIIAFKNNLANESLISIASVLNHFLQFNIKVISNQKCLPKIFNKNVSISNWKNFDKELEESNLVIGNGLAILESIMAEKPAIVVGDKGYGGLVNAQVIENLYSAFFSGRIGGEISEYIPPKLLVDDIIAVKEMGKNEKLELLKYNKSFLIKQQKHLALSFNNLLLKVVNNYSAVQNNLLNCKLEISPDFQLNPINEDNFIVSYEPVSFSHSMIDKECYNIIQRFKEGNKVHTVMQETHNINEEVEFKSFILELLKEKILTIQ